MTCTLVILCGGKAERLGGQAKGLCEIGGRSILQRQLDTLSESFDDLLLVTNTPDIYKEFNLPIIGDERPGCGPLGGLATALAAVKTPQIFLVACDMPFIRKELVQYMLSTAPEADLLVPMVHGFAEPLFSRVATRIRPVLLDQLERQRYKMTDFYARLNVAYIEQEILEEHDPELESFININRLDELQHWTETIK